MMAADNCAHFWVIEEAMGRQQSQGVCRNCGEVKVFCNSIYAQWETQSYGRYKAAPRGRKPVSRPDH